MSKRAVIITVIVVIIISIIIGVSVGVTSHQNRVRHFQEILTHDVITLASDEPSVQSADIEKAISDNMNLILDEYSLDELEESLTEFLSFSDKQLDTSEEHRKKRMTGNLPVCSIQPKSESVPTTVNKLRPGDIQVIGAMGDSLTAGVAAENSNYVFDGDLKSEFRGRVFSVGISGNYPSGQTTLANMLREFNPQLTGGSWGTFRFSYKTPTTKIKDQVQDSPQVGLNVAITGSESKDMYDQAVRFVNKLQKSSEINFEHDWKLMTLFIGGNNLRKFCLNWDQHTPEVFTDDIRKALDYLQAHVPRLYVSIVLPMDVSPVETFTNTAWCKTVRSLLTASTSVSESSGEDGVSIFPCTSRTAGEYSTSLLAQAYRENLEKLADDPKYHNDNFTVVTQPLLSAINYPQKWKKRWFRKNTWKNDVSYFGRDCMHFSQKAHFSTGIALWKSLMKPIGQKPTVFNLGAEEMECPQVPFLPTRGNAAYNKLP